MTRDLKISIWAGLGVTLLLIVMSLPMALRLVPLNRFYGLRVPAAYASEQQWLLMNQVSGISMVASGLVMLAIGAWLLRQHQQGLLGWTEKRLATAFGFLPTLPILLAVALPYAFI